VAGLTTALILARKGKYNITVAAKHMPGDQDVEYASPWAGANSWPLVQYPSIFLRLATIYDDGQQLSSRQTTYSSGKLLTALLVCLSEKFNP
jgi:glycine/D-amino acid oxidase-like deaminating enzyme